jgi:hypothetical protein
MSQYGSQYEDTELLNRQSEMKDLLNKLVSFSKKGERIEAIKQVRHFTGFSLKEAKDIVDVLIPSREVSTPDSDNDYIVVGFDKNYGFMLLSSETSKVAAFDEARHYVENSGYTEVRVAKVIARSRSKEVFDATL